MTRRRGTCRRNLDGFSGGAHSSPSSRSSMLSSARRLALVVLAGALAAPLSAQSRAARIALVLDQPSPRFDPLVEATRKEIQSFFRPGEIEFLPPRAGDGSAASVGALLDAAQKDPSVSVVIAMGAVGSHLLARSGAPARPSIAVSVIDAKWQQIPIESGASGVRRLTYLGTLVECRIAGWPGRWLVARAPRTS